MTIKLKVSTRAQLVMKVNMSIRDVNNDEVHSHCLELIIGNKRKPNDCVMCGVILHELGTQHYHTRLKAGNGTGGLHMNGV